MDAGLARQRFGEGLRGSAPHPRPHEQGECSSLPGLLGSGSDELTKELDRVPDQPSCQGEEEGRSPGGPRAPVSRCRLRTVLLSGAAHQGLRPERPKGTQWNDKLLLSVSKAGPGSPSIPGLPPGSASQGPPPLPLARSLLQANSPHPAAQGGSPLLRGFSLLQRSFIFGPESVVSDSPSQPCTSFSTALCLIAGHVFTLAFPVFILV